MRPCSYPQFGDEQITTPRGQDGWLKVSEQALGCKSVEDCISYCNWSPGRVGTAIALPFSSHSIEMGLIGEEDLWLGCQGIPRLSMAFRLLLFLDMVSLLSFGLWGFWRSGRSVRSVDAGSWEPHWTFRKGKTDRAHGL